MASANWPTTTPPSPQSEPEFGQKYVDLLLQRREPFPVPHQLAFELKFLKKHEAQRLDGRSGAGAMARLPAKGQGMLWTYAA